MKTYSPKPKEIDRTWWVIDATGRSLGRVAADAAKLLRGKHKPTFAPHIDTGDHVIVINCADVALTGRKAEQKFAYRHSGFPGGLKETRYADLLRKQPAKAMEKAIKGMIPHNRLGRQIIRKLHVYDGAEHPHSAQKPQAYIVPEGVR
ncbi:MAG: 50S ribosomal protein L13 [Actinomycetota bacterium]